MSATASDPTSAVRAVIGETIVIKGDVHSQEPLVIEGQVEGTIETGGHLLTVATGGNVRAHIRARNIDMQGRVEGKIQAETVYIGKQAEFIGDLHASSLVIEAGAYIKGNIDVTRQSTDAPPQRSSSSTVLSGDSESRDIRELSHAVLGS
jgi:cytoskeletal protein CcmA (bactofilin family)